MTNKEANARIKINRLLSEAGWILPDGQNDDNVNVCVEMNIKMTKKVIDEMGENFEAKTNGFVDFILLDKSGRPFIVLEAKSEDKDPLVGKEQARNYAKSLNVKYVILSNGNIHYFWNIENGNPQIIVAFPSYESLSEKSTLSVDNKVLVESTIEDDYIVRTVMPNYDEMPDYINQLTRVDFIKNNKLKFLRPYQIRAIKALQKSVKEGNTRFLFEMATGTGKTLTAAAVIKLFLRSNVAKRVLFLVDRIELENQGEGSFKAALKNDYIVYKYKEHPEDWRAAHIVVCTVQTLTSNDRFKRVFKPTDFDLVISDESHRSISGNSRALFEYFWGFKLGLTATPKDYLKNINIERLSERDPRAWERRQMLDTYKTFGCESGEPTFRYNLIDGAKEGYLVNPYVIDARTEITTQLLADEGYAVINIDKESNEEEEETFFQKDFEKKFFSDETNFTFCKTFIEKAKKDPISGEVGKSIVFCVSRKHATRITQMLNEIAFRMYPNMYNSDFAIQVTSDIPLAQSFTQSFITDSNNLNGNTKFLENYKSSKTRVCVTVGMMTTGYDCEDLLNVVLLRPIFSPSDFVQIKGRGTRKHTFKYIDFTNNNNDIRVEKDNFYLFDFFGNVEFFENEYQYDEAIKLPARSKGEDGGAPSIPIDFYINSLIDPIKDIIEINIGLEGMRVDREFFSKFEEKIKNDPVAQDKYKNNMIKDLLNYIDQKIMNKPKEFFTWDKLRRALNVDRMLTREEIIDKVFGIIKEFATKNQLVEEEFNNFILTHKDEINQGNLLMFKKFFEAYLTDKFVRNCIDEGKPKYLFTCQTFSFDDLKKLGKNNMNMIRSYIWDNVNLNRFAS